MTEKERTIWKAYAHEMVSKGEDWWADFADQAKIVVLFDALEKAEARAEQAVAERDEMAKELSLLMCPEDLGECPGLNSEEMCPEGASEVCWIKYAKQQAQKNR